MASVRISTPGVPLGRPVPFWLQSLPNMEGKFTNEYHRLRASLIRVSAVLRQQIDQVLAPFDLTQQQLNILRIVRGAAPTPLTVSVIRDRMLDRAPDASRLVDRLVSKGFLAKAPCQHDKRLVDITLSDKGRDLLAQLDQDMYRIDALLQAVSVEEAMAINQCLAKVMAAQEASSRAESQ